MVSALGLGGFQAFMATSSFRSWGHGPAPNHLRAIIKGRGKWPSKGAEEPVEREGETRGLGPEGSGRPCAGGRFRVPKGPAEGNEFNKYMILINIVDGRFAIKFLIKSLDKGARTP